MRSPRRAAWWGAALGLTLGPSCAWAASAGSWRGATGGSFLKLDVGARSAALGGAYCAVAEDALALYWNPAGLERLSGASAAFLHAFYLGSTSFDHAALARREGWGGWAVGLQTLDGGRITQMDSSGVEVGRYSPRDLAFSAAYAGPSFLGGYSFGVTAKFIRSSVLSSSETGAVDMGLSSPLFIGGRQRFAATLSNLGGRLAIGPQSDSLPLTFRVGGATRLAERWLFALDGIFPNDDAPHAAAGFECLLVKPAPLGLAGRIGFDSRTMGVVDGSTGWSAGFGLVHLGGSFDYAFAPFGVIGMVHRIGATLRWGGRDAGPRSREDREAVPAQTPQIPVPAPVPPPKQAVEPPKPPVRPAGRKRGAGRGRRFLRTREIIDAGDYLKARRAFEEAAGAQPDFDATMVLYPVMIGKLAFTKGDCPRAVDAFQSAIERARTAAFAGEAVADAYAGIGRCLSKEGDVKNAASFFKKALEAGPSEQTRRQVQDELSGPRPSE